MFIQKIVGCQGPTQRHLENINHNSHVEGVEQASTLSPKDINNIVSYSHRQLTYLDKASTREQQRSDLRQDRARLR